MVPVHYIKNAVPAAQSADAAIQDTHATETPEVASQDQIMAPGQTHACIICTIAIPSLHNFNNTHVLRDHDNVRAFVLDNAYAIINPWPGYQWLMVHYNNCVACIREIYSSPIHPWPADVSMHGKPAYEPLVGAYSRHLQEDPTPGQDFSNHASSITILRMLLLS